MPRGEVMILDSDESFADADSYSDPESDFYDEENIAPNVKTSKKSTKAVKKPGKSKPQTKKPAAKKSKKKASKSPEPEPEPVDDEDFNGDYMSEDEPNSPANKKTVEQMYQKKTQLEHILLRPDTYIGSVERLTQPMHVLCPITSKITKKEVTYTPGLYKIFDEILVNAADNKQRDPKMNTMEIEVNATDNMISVLNNGKGIPVVMHKEHNCYVPTLIFGHLLTGSNFDDDEKKTTGGRNGYGAKLANIFSSKFIVECVDSSRKLKLRQVFRDNMSITEEPVITKLTAKEAKAGDSTRISFSPELARFKMNELDADIVGLMSKRAYDIAGAMANRPGKKLSVYLNGEKLPVTSFKSYLDTYKGLSSPVAYEKVGDRWEVGVGPSDGTFDQISFVNAICTSKGGGHTTYIADQIANHLVATVKKKHKGSAPKANQIKNHLCVFVNCLVENPAFDSQTKEFLTTRPKSFGSDCTLSTSFLKSVDKSEIVENILAFAKFKDTQALKRKGGTKKIKLTGIAKLDDANHAGSGKSKDCTLIITEGDSAKSLAMSGLSVVGRDYYGVFPLKGKPLNVRDASKVQVMNNAEIKNIVDILGLKYGVEYDETNIKTLRYGHLMIMADQDHDGSHIKGLVINFIHHFWPSLLNVKGFLQQFITPIVKCSKGKKSITFFTLPEYDAWRENTGNNAKGWNIKYYKGLGTSTSVEAKEYFANLDLHEIHFNELASSSGDEMTDDEPRPDTTTSASDAIDMAFARKRVEDRKTWLNLLQKGTYLNYSDAQRAGVSYSEFINKELILFSQASTLRSIPHLYDGFKPSQRKVLYACFKRKLKGEIKVAQLAGYIGEHAAYHHGEASLTGTVVNMAQNFVGSNNVNLLTPSGQFGTRRMGGQDSASPRYIFTKLEKITRTIFHPDDDALLNYLNDDGMSIEPEYYMPVVPMVLINGAEGIGTGWSTTVPNYNPREVISNLRRLINGEDLIKMKPWYCGFTGEVIESSKPKFYEVKGIITRLSDTSVQITELPVKTWTQNYKEMLEKFLVGDKSKPSKIIEPCITDFKENHTDTTVSFTVTVGSKDILDGWENDKDGLVGKFKLSSSLGTSNMHLFDDEMRIIKYPSPEAILDTFYHKRMEFYVKRKEYLLQVLRREERMLSNKARFVLEVCEGELIVSNRKRKELLNELQDREYELFGDNSKKESSNDDTDTEDNDVDENPTDAMLAKGYEYLLGMKIWSLTYERVEQLRNQLEEKRQAMAELEATPTSSIWMRDLDEVENALCERDAEMDEAAKDELKAQMKNKQRTTKNKKKAAAAKKKGKKKKDEWDSDLEDDDEDDVVSFSSDEEVIKKPAAKRAAPKKASTKPPKVPTKKEEDEPVIALSPSKDTDPKPLSVLSSNLANELNDLSHSLTRTSITPKKEQRKRPSPRNATSSSSQSSSASLASFDTSPFDPVSVTPAPKRKKSTKSKKAAEEKPKKSAVEKKKTVAKKTKKSSEEEEEEEVVIKRAAPSRARSARGAAKKKITYMMESSEDEDDDDDVISLVDSESDFD